jgi:four helix bundle protein
MRRAARSIGAQIAEAWAKRRYEKHFVSKLTDADAEQMETQHWVSEALDSGYISSEDEKKLTVALLEIGRMLNGMIRKSDVFCGDSSSLVKEDNADYFGKPITDY